MNLPNRLTCARLGICAVFTVVLEIPFPGRGGAALALFLVAGLTDWLDGYLARRMGLITDLGKLLDPLADKILVCVGYIGLVSLGWVPVWMMAVIVAREFLITGLRTLAAAQGVVMAAEKLGKHKTVTQMLALGFGLLLLAIEDAGMGEGAMLLKLRHWVLGPLLWLAVLLTVWSGLSYFWKNRRLVLHGEGA